MNPHLFKDGSKIPRFSILGESTEQLQGILQGWQKPSRRLNAELGTHGQLGPPIYRAHLSQWTGRHPHLPTLAHIWASDTDHTLSTPINDWWIDEKMLRLDWWGQPRVSPRTRKMEQISGDLWRNIHSIWRHSIVSGTCWQKGIQDPDCLIFWRFF